MSGDTEAPPTYYFDGITFNPSFYQQSTTSNYLTYPTAQGTETIADLNATNINAIGSTLYIGPNGTTNSSVILGSDTTSQTNIKSAAIGLLANTTITGNLTAIQATTSNSYNFLGTTPTLTKASLGYFVNYAQITSSYSTSSKFLYTPNANTSTLDSHYLNPGVYIANIHTCVAALAGQTYSGKFSLGVSTGTNIQSMPVNSQYGTINIESLDLTALNNGLSLAGNYSTYSHSGCFTLTSSNFVNLELNLKVQSGTTMTFSLYGCIHRIA